jgi:O-antigen/teichoic acid export membrane protein
MAALWRPVVWQAVELTLRAAGLVLLCRAVGAAELGALLLWATVAAFGSVAISAGGASFTTIELGRAPGSARSIHRSLVRIRLRIWLLVALALGAGAVITGQGPVLPALFALILLFGGNGPLGAGSLGAWMTTGALDALGKVERESLHRLAGAAVAVSVLALIAWRPALVRWEWLPLAPLAGGVTVLALGLHALRGRISGDGPAPKARLLLLRAGPLWLYAILGLVQSQSDLLLLRGHVPAADLGAYGMAARLLAVILLPVMVLGRLVVPILSAPAADARERLERLRAPARLALMVLVPAGIVLAAGLADPLLAILGREYTAAAPALRILSLELVVMALFCRAALWLACVEGRRWFVAGLLAAAASSVALNLALIPGFGIAGAAAAHLASLLIGHLVWQIGFSVLPATRLPAAACRELA